MREKGEGRVVKGDRRGAKGDGAKGEMARGRGEINRKVD